MTKANIWGTNNLDRFNFKYSSLLKEGKSPRWFSIGNCMFITTTPILEAEKKRQYEKRK